MRIGDLAKRGGVSVETIRFYERRGLLPDPLRTPSGYRWYAEEDLHRLRFIRQAKALGFSLKEIATILAMRKRGRCPCGEVMRIGEQHLRESGEQIRRMRRFHAELSRALRKWKRLRTSSVSADAICVLIERTMEPANGKERR